MSKIVKFSVPDRQADSDLVGLLEELLERAKSGEVCGLAAAVQLAPGTEAEARFCFDERYGLALVGCLVQMQHYLFEAWEE